MTLATKNEVFKYTLEEEILESLKKALLDQDTVICEKLPKLVGHTHKVLYK